MLLNLSRRDFLKGTAGAGGLVIGVQMGASQFLTSPAEAAHHGLEANLFVTIASDGSVTITCARVEMGQGVRTTLPMIVADELEADIDRCSVVQADADQKWGDFGQELDTDGSRSVRRDFQHLREAGAGARMMLEQAAADMWGVPVGEGQNRTRTLAPEAVVKAGVVIGSQAYRRAAAPRRAE